MNIIFIITMVFVTIGVFGLPIWNLARLKQKAHWLWAVVPPIIFLGIFWLTGTLESDHTLALYKFFRPLSFYWLIIGMMLFGISIIVSLFSIAFKLSKKTTFILIVSLTGAYALFAGVNGERIVVKNVDLPASNISREYNFVHITDLHSGSTDRAHAQRVVDVIKKLDPEFVVITGDFIDEFFVSTSDIDPFNDLSMPIYLVTGNHEYYLEPGTIQRVIEGTNINLIDNMKVSFDELDIIGVDELQTVDNTLAMFGGVNEDRYTLLLDHQPLEEEVERAEQGGVSLMLSGHTHKGQIWPMGLLIKFRFIYVGGLYKIGNMFLYVNQGTGTLGPKMRVGTANEITYISLDPTKK